MSIIFSTQPSETDRIKANEFAENNLQSTPFDSFIEGVYQGRKSSLDEIRIIFSELNISLSKAGIEDELSLIAVKRAMKKILKQVGIY